MFQTPVKRMDVPTGRNSQSGPTGDYYGSAEDQSKFVLPVINRPLQYEVKFYLFFPSITFPRDSFKAHVHRRSIYAKMSARQSLLYLCWPIEINDPICVTPPKVVKARTKVIVAYRWCSVIFALKRSPMERRL